MFMRYKSSFSIIYEQLTAQVYTKKEQTENEWKEKQKFMT